jgi:hypothetical protein
VNGSQKGEAISVKYEVIGENETRGFETPIAAAAKAAQWIKETKQVRVQFNAPRLENVQSNRAALQSELTSALGRQINSADVSDRVTRYWL